MTIDLRPNIDLLGGLKRPPFFRFPHFHAFSCPDGWADSNARNTALQRVSDFDIINFQIRV